MWWSVFCALWPRASSVVGVAPTRLAGPPPLNLPNGSAKQNPSVIATGLREPRNETRCCQREKRAPNKFRPACATSKSLSPRRAAKSLPRRRSILSLQHPLFVGIRVLAAAVGAGHPRDCLTGSAALVPPVLELFARLHFSRPLYAAPNVFPENGRLPSRLILSSNPQRTPKPRDINAGEHDVCGCCLLLVPWLVASGYEKRSPDPPNPTTTTTFRSPASQQI